MLSAEYIHKYKGISSILNTQEEAHKKTQTGSRLHQSYPGVLRILTQDVWGNSRKGLCHAPTAQAYRTALWPVVRATGGCNSASGRALLLFYLPLGKHKNTLFCSTVKPTDCTHSKVSSRLPNNESAATYLWKPPLKGSLFAYPAPLSLVHFLFYSFSLIVCNSYQVSLRPASVASNSAVGKPSVCCQHFIGFQGGGLLLFSVILARQ